MNDGVIVKIGIVVSVNDSEGGDRIKVKVHPEDNSKDSEDKIKWAFPLLPKMLHVKPKIGEYVFVFSSEAGDSDKRRYYIGPIVPQETFLFNSADLFALSMIEGKHLDPPVNPKMKPESDGAFPEESDISIEGRKSCGIQIKDDDIRIKAGVKKVGGQLNKEARFNEDNTHAFIKLKYDNNGIVPDNVAEYNSTATIVADKINLIGNRSKDPECNFNTNDRKDLINDAEMANIIERAHQLPYGDVLCDILTDFYKVFANHKHKWAMKTPNDDDLGVSTLGEKISNLKETMLSDNVRIN